MSNHTNLFKTKLVGSYSNSDTVITVEDASELTTFPTKLVIFNAGVGDPSDAFGAGEAEIVNATGKTTNDITIERGQENTSAVALSDGWDVYQTITAETIDGKANLEGGNTFTGNQLIDEGRIASKEIINNTIPNNTWIYAFTVGEMESWLVFCAYTRSDPTTSVFASFTVFRGNNENAIAQHSPITEIDDGNNHVRLRLNGNDVEYLRSAGTGGGNRQTSLTAIKLL